DPYGLFELSDPVCNQMSSELRCTFYVRVAGVLNYEFVNTINLLSHIRDEGGAEVKQAIEVKIKDINDRPKDILLSGSTYTTVFIDQNTTWKDTIAMLSTVDDDIGQRYKYMIIRGAGNLFILDG
ncbi:unnamed protein product, partial [Owenia fusiformis]